MKTALYFCLGLLLAAIAMIELGILRGSQPADLGVHAARLKPPSPTRNSVSSQAALYTDHPQRTYADIKPLPLKGGDATNSVAALTAALRTMPNITVMESQPDYVYAQAQTRWLKFVERFGVLGESGTGRDRTTKRQPSRA